MTNNIKVSLLAFGGGFTFGAFTTYVLLYNGAMLGEFAVKHSTKTAGLKFWSIILPHGIIELTAIMISGGAGLILGWALVAPKNLSRLNSLRKASREALPLMGGVVAMLVVAGCIEGYFSPSNASATAKLIFAGFTAIVLIVYFGFAGRDLRDNSN